MHVGLTTTMYIPKHHEETDTSILHALIKAHPLGSWITQGDGELIANHIPFLLDPTRGEHGTLVGHVARANRVWQSFSTTVNSWNAATTAFNQRSGGSGHTNEHGSALGQHGPS